MEHVKLFLTFFNLILGSFIIMFLLSRQRIYRGAKFFIQMAVYSLLYNLLLTGALIGKYININLPALFSFTENPYYIQFSQVAFILIMGSMFLLQFFISFSLSGIKPDKKITGRLKLFLFTIAAAVSAGSVLLSMGYSHAYIFLESIGDLLFICEFLVLVKILSGSFSSRDRRIILLKRSYSILLLSRYPLIFLMLFIPGFIRFYSAVAVLFYLNIIPLLWTLLFFRRGTLLEKSSSAIEKKKNITPREQEIIQLILNGKSNGEIEEILFISSHTVKNHIYNIYRKLNVKSRYELINLYTRD